MSKYTNFEWAVTTLFTLQKSAMVGPRLAQAVSRAAQEPTTATRLSRLARSLNTAQPLKIDSPRAECLPLLWADPAGRHLVVSGLTPDGRLRALTQSGEDELLDLTADGAFYQIKTAAEKSVERTFSQTIKHACVAHYAVLSEVVLASIAMAAVSLGVSVFSMQVYDRVVPTQGLDTLWVLAIGAVLAVGVESWIKFARAQLLNNITSRIDAYLANDTFVRLLGIRIDQLPASVGGLASQVRGYEQVRAFFATNVIYHVVDLPMGVLFVLVMLLLGSWQVALVPLTTGAIALAWGIRHQKKIMSLSSAGAKHTNAKTGMLVEAVDAIETIKSTGGAWMISARWKALCRKIIQGDAELRSSTDHLAHGIASLQQLNYIAVVSVGALQVMAGNITSGALLACSIMGGRAIAPLLQLPSIITQRAQARSAAEGLDQLYRLSQDNGGVSRPLTPSSLDGEFRLSEVEFSYGQGESKGPTVLTIDELLINQGERIGVIGPVGSGKSTLLRLMAGLYKPVRGRVLLGGLDLSHVDPSVLNRHIGYVPQDHRLISGTLRENLLMGIADPGDTALRDAMRRTGLLRIVSQHPQGLELPIYEGGRGLSAGQRQLVALTRLLIADPATLLLDEPTASMDAVNEATCLAAIGEQVDKGKTLVLITHKIALLEMVDRLIVVLGRKIVADGPRERVLPELVRAGLSAQSASTKAAAGQRPSALGTRSGPSSRVTRKTPTVADRAHPMSAANASALQVEPVQG